MKNIMSVLSVPNARAVLMALVYVGVITFLLSDGGMGAVTFFMATTGKIVSLITPGGGGGIIFINLLGGLGFFFVPIYGVKLIARNGLQKDAAVGFLARAFGDSSEMVTRYTCLIVVALIIAPFKGVLVILAQSFNGFFLFNKMMDSPISFSEYFVTYSFHAPLELLGFALVASATAMVGIETLKKVRAVETLTETDGQDVVASLKFFAQRKVAILFTVGLVAIAAAAQLERFSFAKVMGL